MIKIIALVFIVVFFSLGMFLDVTKEAKKADIIVSLGGSGQLRASKAVDLLENNFSKHKNVICFAIKGQFLWHIRNNDDLKKKFEVLEYIENSKNTMDEIILIEKILKKYNYNSVIIVTSPSHSRRVDFLIQQFSKDLNSKYNYIIVSSNPKWWNKYFYFLDFKAIGISLIEVNKLLYNYVKYTLLEDTTIIKHSDKLAKEIKS